jgi:hypothetical protein
VSIRVHYELPARIRSLGDIGNVGATQEIYIEYGQKKRVSDLTTIASCLCSSGKGVIP